MSYEVTRMRNSESQHWRGELRGFAVTQASHVHARMRASAPIGINDFLYRGSA
jgi:hypothetical protein